MGIGASFPGGAKADADQDLITGKEGLKRRPDRFAVSPFMKYPEPHKRKMCMSTSRVIRLSVLYGSWQVRLGKAQRAEMLALFSELDKAYASPVLNDLVAEQTGQITPSGDAVIAAGRSRMYRARRASWPSLQACRDQAGHGFPAVGYGRYDCPQL